MAYSNGSRGNAAQRSGSFQSNRGVGDGSTFGRSQGYGYNGNSSGGSSGTSTPTRGGRPHGAGGHGDRSGGFSQAQPPTRNITQILPHDVDATTLRDNPTKGWIAEDKLKRPLSAPVGKEPGTSYGRKIPIIVNSVEVKIDLGDRVFQYDVDIRLSEASKQARLEAKKDTQNNVSTPMDEVPKPRLWNKIMIHVIPAMEVCHENITKKRMKIASDFSKAIYTTEPFAMIDSNSPEFILPVEMNDIPGNFSSSDIYNVTVKQSAVIETSKAKPCFKNLKKFISDKQQVPSNMADIERVYNVVIKTSPSLTLTSVGRASFFPPPTTGVGYRLGGGVVNWQGYSLIYTLGWRNFINIDMANAAFILGLNVLQVLEEVVPRKKPQNGTDWTPADIRKANDFLINCAVFYYQGTERRECKIKEVLRRPAREHRFNATGKDGAPVPTNVEEYFRNNYNMRLRFPDGLCLKVGKDSIIPAEFCTIKSAQQYTKPMSVEQTGKMIRDTAKPPVERKGGIEGFLRMSDFEGDPVMKDFKMTVPEAKLHEVSGARVIEPPELVYRDKLNSNLLKGMTPGKDGVWNIPVGAKFFQSANNGKAIPWTVLVARSASAKSDQIRSFVEKLIEEGKKRGVNLGNWSDVMKGKAEYDVRNPKELHGALKKFQEAKYRFVLVVLIDKDVRNYSDIKTKAETKESMNLAGILTQCVTAGNVCKGDKSVIENIMKKLNAKLGGVNHLVNFPEKFKDVDVLRCPTLILGADVTHPQQGSKYPSLAAVTGSLDRTGMAFNMDCRAQTKAERGAAEVIEQLEEMVARMIIMFVNITGYKPRKILFFRDGVGDGQFSEVLEKEMIAIRRACKKLSNEIFKRAENDIALGEKNGVYEPKITFIAVQKRHKTRFFPKNPNVDGVGRPKNCPPGTVVDTDIVNARTIDYYMISHTGIQGTSKPTRYQVLWDDSEFTMDQLQVISYWLCYGYARCTRAVSYPCPTYYAHLACTRAKVYCGDLTDNQLQDLDLVNARLKRADRIIKDFPMHYL